LRKIKLNIHASVGNISEDRSKRYTLSLSRDTVFYFQNKKIAQQKRVEIEKYYTNHILLLNDLFVQAFSNYRYYVFTLKPYEIAFMKETFNDIEKHFDKALKPTDSPNSNYFKFGALQFIYDGLSSINSFLSQKSRVKQDHVMSSKCEATDLHILSLKEMSQKFNQKFSKTYSYESTLQVIHLKNHA
jgi:hypothetical protein